MLQRWHLLKADLATLLLELERALGWPFFDPLKGGDPLLWQHLLVFASQTAQVGPE